MIDIKTYEPSNGAMLICSSGGGYVKKADHDATITSLREEIAALKAEKEAAEAKNARSHIQKDRDYWHNKAMDMLHGTFTQCCSYCGWEAPPPNGWEELQKHINECPHHPIASLRAENERLGESEVRYVDKIIELRKDNSSLRSRVTELEAELAPLRKVVGLLKIDHHLGRWIVTDHDAKAANLDIAKLQKMQKGVR